MWWDKVRERVGCVVGVGMEVLYVFACVWVRVSYLEGSLFWMVENFRGVDRGRLFILIYLEFVVF